MQEDFVEASETTLVTVLNVNNPADIALAKSILDDAKIRHMVKGDRVLQDLYGMGQVEIQVFASDAERARGLLSDI
ncbi:MAG TPA: hypothetical protein DIU35_10105 [Candidatus Latescibacteria bacterium]|nr:hypothetical protein [Gemmatimonadota bacterium]HCR17824.1 hypothetical protein [Candidatus Latescibacterota bacterium]